MNTQVPARPRKTAVPADKAAVASGDLKPLDLKRLLRTLQAVREGDFSVRMPGDAEGITGKIADTLNEIISSNQRLAREMERAGKQVGKEGRTQHRIALDRRSGSWGEIEASFNTLIDDLLWPRSRPSRKAICHKQSGWRLEGAP
jgi:hypothetical protein